MYKYCIIQIKNNLKKEEKKREIFVYQLFFDRHNQHQNYVY